MCPATNGLAVIRIGELLTSKLEMLTSLNHASPVPLPNPTRKIAIRTFPSGGVSNMRPALCQPVDPVQLGVEAMIPAPPGSCACNAPEIGADSGFRFLVRTHACNRNQVL